MQKLKLPEVEELTPSLSVPILDSGPLLSVKEISFIACDESRLLTGYDRQGVPTDGGRRSTMLLRVFDPPPCTETA
ncbi:uncharacterized protein CPUR_08464 [Claviceps purpurea 20.1]|uniref:Uncharacterized protein n=1 Tax=Claviceps purpurea (strain 20.1) TaxID=1111077 RepID=M1W6C3_CLAP2|nr:uncharacterized protein CPUR_08464 [Claviceps purpurea 20.1]